MPQLLYRFFSLAAPNPFIGTDIPGKVKSVEVTHEVMYRSWSSERQLNESNGVVEGLHHSSLFCFLRPSWKPCAFIKSELPVSFA